MLVSQLLAHRVALLDQAKLEFLNSCDLRRWSTPRFGLW